ncbi:MAG TPA: winged helix-turn-helix domain-containing protein [Buttiauxella sp.]
MRYLLHGMLVFDLKEGSLSTVDTGQSIKLPYPAVLLLDVFCQNVQVLIPRDTLMDKAWTDNGFRGSGSNLYNSLSSIRKAISTLGIEQQAIRTQPKVGFVLELSVTLMQPDLEEQSENDRIKKADGGGLEIKSSELPPETDALAPQENRQTAPSVDIDSFFYRLRLSKFGWLLTANNYLLWSVLIITILVAIQVSFNLNSDKNGILPANYDLMASEQKCSLFRLDPLTDIYPSISAGKKIEKLAAKFNVDCKSNKANFYIHSGGVVHKLNDIFNVLIVMCIYNKQNGLVTSCFNDYSVFVAQHENKE